MKKTMNLLFVLLVNTLFCQTYFSEDFAQGEIPSAWSIQQTNSESTWKISLQQPDGHYEVVCTTPLGKGPSDEWLISPSFSLEGATSPILDLFSNFSRYSAEQNQYTFEILASGDDGNTWQVVWDTFDYAYWVDWIKMRIVVDLSAFKEKSNVKLALRVKAANSDQYSNSIWASFIKVKEDDRVQTNSVKIYTENNVPPTVTKGETLQLLSEVLPSNANQKVVWTIVSGQNLASIWEGKVTANNVGQIRVRAASAEFPNIFDEMDINIINPEFDPCNQKYEGNLTYVTGINNTVNQLVANDIFIPKNTEFQLNGLGFVVNYDINNLHYYPKFKVKIYSDNDGLPGEVLKEIDNLSVNPPYTGGPYQEISVTFPTAFEFPVAAQDTKYWISITANDEGAPVRWAAYDVNEEIGAFGSDDNGLTWSPKINSSTNKQVNNFFNLFSSCSNLAVNEVRENSKILLYPNPTTDYFYLSNNNSVESVTITDITGAIHRTLRSDVNGAYSIQDIPKGMYIVVVKLKSSEVISKKVIKK